MAAGTLVNRILAGLLSWLMVMSPFPLRGMAPVRDYSRDDFVFTVYEGEE